VKRFRNERIADLIAEEISLILRTKAADNRFLTITITGAKVSRDLKIAHVFVAFPSNISSAEQELAHLQQAGRFLRGELGRRLKMRYVPELKFIYDDSFERGQRIMAELDAISSETSHISETDDSDR
jgi:ribosome-binding factor A